MRRKINQMTAKWVAPKNSAFYSNNQEQFEYFLNSDIGVAETMHNYIPDLEIVTTLRRIPTEQMDSITALIGYSGIGKSSDIRYSFKLSNSAPKLCTKNKTVILLSNFDGNIEDENKKDSDERAVIIHDLAQRVSSVCSVLERENPELRAEFHSPDGRENFLKFIQETEPKILTDDDDTQEETTVRKLAIARKNNSFIYFASKVKYYLSRPNCVYERILLIADNVELLADIHQQQLLLQYLKLFSCMRKFPDGWTGKRVYINLLISMRPSTYCWLKKTPIFSFYSIRELYKNQRMDLWSYFMSKANALPDEVRKSNPPKWQEAGNVIIKLCEKFDKKYANMIMGLADMNVRSAMRIISRILSNPVWITQAACTDKNAETSKDSYVFNNITVIRAISCGTNLVYTNGEDQLIPNVLYNTAEEDNSIISLYIIAYFITHKADFMMYGENYVHKEDLVRDFCDVFGENDGLKNRVCRTVNYLYRYGILCLSDLTRSTDRAEAVSSTSNLYLSAKGIEIWNMLGADSVLAEMYREDYFREYSSSDPVKSSFDFMQQNNQESIFIDLYKMLDELLGKSEQPMIEEVCQNGAEEIYKSLFGGHTMVEHLMQGINCSVEYSGKKGNKSISNYRGYLDWKIGCIQQKL